jgi:preprotein translocase subunit YajC
VAGFIPLILIFGLMYVLMIRPQQRKVKDQQALVSSISAGDEVVLSSGIFGVVKEVDGDDENVLWIEVYSGIELKILRSAVDRRFNEATTVAEELVAEELVAEEPVTEEPGEEVGSEETGSDEA